MTDKKQGYQSESVGDFANPPNCKSGVIAPPKEDRLLIFIPKDGNYIEILGHRIDGFESFEAFCEHLKNYAVLEETVKTQKAEIERLKDYPKCVYEYDGDITDYCLKTPCPNYKTVDAIRAEAVKEFDELLKEDCLAYPLEKDDLTMLVDVKSYNNLVKEMVGADGD